MSRLDEVLPMLAQVAAAVAVGAMVALILPARSESRAASDEVTEDPGAAAPGPAQPAAGADRGRFLSPSGTEIELLLSESNLGGAELQIGEITFPPGTNSGDHLHGATEVFYVLEGELEHVVDGVSEILGPGDLGFVRPPSRVNHIVDPDGPPARALVIWAPGGEGTRIVENWERR